MCEINFVLFIGGSKDGQLRSMINLKQEMILPIYDPAEWMTTEETLLELPKIEYEAYRLHKLAAGTRYFNLMIINDMSIEEATHLLLTNYKRNLNDTE